MRFYIIHINQSTPPCQHYASSHHAWKNHELFTRSKSIFISVTVREFSIVVFVELHILLILDEIVRG